MNTTTKEINMSTATAERFWNKVEKSDSCWFWTAGVGSDGYGKFWNGSFMAQAHRVVYEMEVGAIPEGLQLDHLCRNRACVNPAHFEVVTSAENTRRGDAGKAVAAFHKNKTHCPHGHPYNKVNTYEYKGRRECKECRRTRARK